MPIYVTKQRLDAWIATAGLTPADRSLAAKLADLVAAANSGFGGILRDANDAAAAAAVELSVSDYYKLRLLAAAAGLLEQVA